MDERLRSYVLDLASHAHRPWAMDPQILLAMMQLEGTTFELPAQAIENAEAVAARRRTQRVAGGAVAVVPLKGVITPQGSFLTFLFTGDRGGLEAFRQQVGEALADPEVKSIVLDVDSPGGIVDQVPETAAFLRQARKQKPIVAVANPLMASAAYWLGSQATQLVTTTSGETGSIGVYQLHRDLSAAHAQAGIKPTLISAGRFKTEGNPFEPLDKTATDALQAAVNDFYDLFVKDVATGRGVSQQAIRDGYGEGRVLTAPRAKKANLVDTVATLEETVGLLGQGKLPARRAHAGDSVVGFTDFVEAGEFELIEAKADNDDDFSYQEAPRYSSEEKERVLETLLG